MRTPCPTRSPFARLLATLLIALLLVPSPSIASAIATGVHASGEDPPPAFVTSQKENTPTRAGDGDRDEQEQSYAGSRVSYGIQVPRTVVTAGSPPESRGERPQLSPAEIAARQRAVVDFLRRRSGTLTPADAVEIYRLAGDYTVIHGMLGAEITPETSRQIAHMRHRIHTEAIDLMTRRMRSEGVSRRLGINDFGSSSYPDVNAKMDVDVTLYPERAGVSGADLVTRYRAAFHEVTRGYGTQLDPGIMDIVAHRYEATIPDWRQVQTLADFEVRLRQGTTLLRQNPEAYFLEGAYVRQVLGRSVDPAARTFTWYRVDDDGRLTHETVNAGEVRQFFYHPEAARRYAFGGAVGNWHFWNSHPDLILRAKYLLRSVDDGRGLLLPPGTKLGDYADIPFGERQALVDTMYADASPEMRYQIRAVLDTAVLIRQLTRQGADLSSPDGLRRAFAPLVEFERTLQFDGRKTPELSEDALLRLAQDRFQRVAKTVLVDNIVKASTARLNDWLAPRVRPQLRYWMGSMIDMDPQRQQRLQYAAFFELRDALSVMDAGMIERIKRQNPRYRRDIEILEGIIRRQREMMLTPDNVPPSETLAWRKQAILDAEALYEQFRQRLLDQLSPEMRARVEQRLGQFNAAWARGQELEDWLQTGMFDAMLVGAGRPAAANLLQHVRESARATNERFISPTWMLRIAKANSLINVLTVYHQQGEVNAAVVKTALWEVFTYVPVLGLGMDVYAGGGTAVWNLVLVRVLPVYGPLLLMINTAKGVATLAGTVAFEPLKRDKLLLAYQGYLDPQDSGLVLAGVGRTEGARPGLLHWVDPELRLGVDERRAKFYEFFAPRVLAATQRVVPDGTDPLFRDEWLAEYGKQLMQALDRYIEEWSTGTGEWAQFDTLALDRALDTYLMDRDAGQPFREQLKAMLVDDFMKGQALAAQKRASEREALFKALLEEVAGLAGRSRLLDGELDNLREDCETAGHVAYALAVDEMPETPASIEILAAPRVVAQQVENAAERPDLRAERVQFRAKVTASARSHPTPWRVAWRIEHAGQTAEVLQAGSSDKLQSEGGGTIAVHAQAIDANDQVFARASLPLQVERREAKPEQPPGFVEASNVEAKSNSAEREASVGQQSQWLLWIEERGTWCYFGSGPQESFEKVRQEGRWCRQMAGPFDSREALDSASKSWKSRAKLIDIPGHGRKHYVEVGGRLCFLGVADTPGGESSTGGVESTTGPTADSWTLHVSVVDVNGQPVDGARVELPGNWDRAKSLGGGRYIIGPLTIPRVQRTPMTVTARAVERGGAGVLSMERFAATDFLPEPGPSTAVTIRFPYPMVAPPVERPPEPDPVPPAGSTPPVEHVWSFDPNRPFEIKAIAPAKKPSSCLEGAEVLDESRMQVTVEQDGRQENLMGERAMEVLKIKQFVVYDGERCGWIFTERWGEFGPGYTQGAPDREPMSRHDCIIKYCPMCEGAMLFDEPADGSPCDYCIKEHSEAIDHCAGGGS